MVLQVLGGCYKEVVPCFMRPIRAELISASDTNTKECYKSVIHFDT
jgi:hypothetical protein